MRVEQRQTWRPAVAWLVDAVRHVSNLGEAERRRPVPTSVADEDLAAIADFHGVQGFARLAATGEHPVLDQAVHRAQVRHLRAMADLGGVVAALDSAAIGFLVAKGPALVATSYGGTHLRSYVDLDLLVRPRDLKDSVDALEGAGYRLLDANWPLLTAHRVQELRLEGPTGGAVDLHWSLGDESGAANTAPSADRLLDRAVRITAGSVSFLIPGPADLAIHVAVHAASSGGHRLVWLTDMRGALRHALVESSPGELLETARDWRALAALSLMARRTRRLLGTDIPAELTRPLPLRVWGGVDLVASAVSPPPMVGEGSSPSRLVARSSRATVSSSLVAATRKGWSWARTGRPVPPGRELMHDPTNPLSALYPAGGTEAAEAFYARVADQGRG